MTDSITTDRILRLAGILTQARRVTVVTHTRPDGDAVGSGTAMVSYLTGCLGAEARLTVADAYSDTLDFILGDEGADALMQYDVKREETGAWVASSDLIVCLDCNGFERTGALEEPLRASSATKVLIDHHLGPHEEDFDLTFSETRISSASELLYHILVALPGIDGDPSRLPMRALRALMAGMTTDTNNFANSVFPSTLEMASRLLAAGVDRDDILDRIYNRYRENRLRVIGYALKDKLTVMPNGTAYIVLDSKDLADHDVREGELEGLVNMPLALGEVRMSLLLKQDSAGYYRVSVRSKKGTSANCFAVKYFNGGGHEQAAGGRLYFPRDIAESSQAAAYVERAANDFLK